MTTICSGCGNDITNKETKEKFVPCSHCHRHTPKGANSYNKIKEVKMGEEKQFTGKSTFTICSKCKQKKFTRAEVYAKRIAKFGSVEEMEKSYVCRNCKKA